MNVSTRIATAVATAVLAAAGSSAFAVDAEQFVPPQSTLTRAAVKADLAQAIASGMLVRSSEATEFVDRGPAGSTRSREEVKAEARYAARHHVINDYSIGG